MLKQSVIISFLFISVISATNHSIAELSTQIHAQKVSEQLDAYMQALTKLNRFSGSVVVAKGNTILLNKGYGFASHEFEIPNTPQTRFRICSITKMITAAAIMQLQERGLLQVSDSISKYLPDYPRGHEITIHHLLTHTSGVSSGNMPLEMVVSPATLEQIISFYKNEPLEYGPGADYRYSNAGYLLLSAIIERISGKSYTSFIKENILVPVNMHESFFRDCDYGILKNCACGYCLNEINELVNGHYVYENFKGSGGLFCTAYDLYMFVQALNTGGLMSKSSLQTMFTPYHNKENYGYGCHIDYLEKNKFIEHGGMLSSGFKSNVSVFIDDEIYIVILSNFFSAWVNETRDALAAIMFGSPYDFPSNDAIKVDPVIYNDYTGTYDHPSFKSGYTIERKGDKLYVPENRELSPVAVDQFMALNRNANNIVYKFIRNEKGHMVQLRIKGGGPYFEVRCDKL
ncbi:MAG: serine hydrolase [Candidatus Babeliaceae bacterium]